jgi:cellulose synthase/poly-beta-1,6-N-acetylglucosamine synthase-like glycosyltransferase
VGLSSALIGSGMAFEFNYLQKLLVGIGDTVGEDKEIDFRIAKDGVKICYLDKVYVYDEKIEDAQVFTQQRTRWISAQLEFLRKYSKEGLVQLFRNGNFEFFNKVLQAYLVPRMLLIGVLGLLFLLSFILPVGPPVVFWFVLLVMLAAALLIYGRPLFAYLTPFFVWLLLCSASTKQKPLSWPRLINHKAFPLK